MINKFLEYREKEKAKITGDCSCLKLGDVTTINLTGLSGGLAPNIVPNEFRATFDIRITPKISIQDFEQQLLGWIAEAEGPVKGSITYECKQMETSKFALTSIDEASNLWWKTFVASAEEMGLDVSAEVFPGATDSRFLREKGIPALGFSSMNNTPVLMHDHNEYLNESVFLRGIDILYKIVLDVANLN